MRAASTSCVLWRARKALAGPPAMWCKSSPILSSGSSSCNCNSRRKASRSGNEELTEVPVEKLATPLELCESCSRLTVLPRSSFPAR
eukprot:CAMPEP_0204116214 /NCGR_PEP_ID=MMETSP0361-20130328/5273_1 /ASSEMBLY_ACC=CAM_ASM_000343 /TAXON_ID=268821 /ORGANISM="Scrippsiella Hangoei, Strain SHTV-5" /LENGTH=86 /DNA_ID=CAMNT_0051066969 /DNA_START=444 /DNA_END=704 /DNA_ORIENTATION=-